MAAAQPAGAAALSHVQPKAMCGHGGRTPRDASLAMRPPPALDTTHGMMGSSQTAVMRSRRKLQRPARVRCGQERRRDVARAPPGSGEQPPAPPLGPLTWPGLRAET